MADAAQVRAKLSSPSSPSRSMSFASPSGFVFAPSWLNEGKRHPKPSSLAFSSFRNKSTRAGMHTFNGVLGIGYTTTWRNIESVVTDADILWYRIVTDAHTLSTTAGTKDTHNKAATSSRLADNAPGKYTTSHENEMTGGREKRKPKPKNQNMRSALIPPLFPLPPFCPYVSSTFRFSHLFFLLMLVFLARHPNINHPRHPQRPSPRSSTSSPYPVSQPTKRKSHSTASPLHAAPTTFEDEFPTLVDMKAQPGTHPSPWSDSRLTKKKVHSSPSFDASEPIVNELEMERLKALVPRKKPIAPALALLSQASPKKPQRICLNKQAAIIRLPLSKARPTATPPMVEDDASWQSDDDDLNPGISESITSSSTTTSTSDAMDDKNEFMHWFQRWAGRTTELVGASARLSGADGSYSYFGPMGTYAAHHQNQSSLFFSD